VTDTLGEVIECMYDKKGVLVTGFEGFPLEKVSAADTVYTVEYPRRVVIVKDPSEFTRQPLSAYDELKNRLLKVKERFTMVEDPEDIIIAAENEVLYDKIIQIMDVAREAGFPNAAIAKLRS